MQDDCIAVAVGLPQLKILRQKEMEGHFEVTVIYRRKEVICSWYGKVFAKPDEVFAMRRGSSYGFREYSGQEALH